jgi:hypothetical protein
LKGREGDQRAEQPEDVEPGHHRRFGPAQLLEMVVERRHPENPVRVGVLAAPGPLVPLIGPGLDENRESLGDEHAPDDQEEKFGFDQNGDRTEGSTDGQAPGVPHEHLGRMRVEPEKPDGAAHQGTAEDGQFPGARKIEKVEVSSRIDPAV